MAMEINILIEEGLEVETDSAWLQKILEKSLVAENTPPNSEISLVLTGQERMQKLNREYRGKNRPTDVLSFSMTEQKEEAPTAFIEPPDGLIHLGEIIISYPQAVIQAGEKGHAVGKELAILLVHGILHILGYDHEKADLAPVMAAREREILSDLAKEVA
jgi:probable rRNA maturation factor